VVDERARVVARRAAGLACARQVALPDDLDLWRLAGGRPAAAPADGEPEELGELLEQTIDAGRRRELGAHFTPAALARSLVERALDGHRSPRVGDPACGGGAILLAAARHLAARGEAPREVVQRLWARDVDPLAVATTEAALALWAGGMAPRGRCSVGDALLDDAAWPALDVVVGNPPFLTPLASATSRSAPVARRLRDRFGGVVGAYTDAAALFLLAGSRLVRPGGTVALIQPVSVLTNRDASGVRAAVDAIGTMREVWMPSGRAFAAAVDVCVPIFDVREAWLPAPAPGAGTSAAPRSWASHISGDLGVPPVELTGRTRLADVAEVVAAFRTEYYGTIPHVHEEDDLPHGRPLLTTGLVDLGGVAWSDRSARVGRRTWQRPVVDAGALEGRAARWLERTAGPKVVVATQTKVVELAVDEDGRYVAGVPLVVVRPEPDRLWHIAAALAAPAVSAWVRQRSAGSGLSAAAVRVSAPLLREVPLPVDTRAWDEGASAFRHRDLDGFVGSMALAYDVGPEIGAWWTPLARSVWSPAAALR
jgi:hypothetical protein